MTLSKPAACYISHAAPMILERDLGVQQFLGRLGASLKPAAVLVVNAHWQTASPLIGLPRAPAGFASAPLAVAAEASALLSAAGFPGEPVTLGTTAFDQYHAVWLPLALMFPEGPPPVATVSIQMQAGTAHHLAVGAALRSLRDQGVLILGSGSLTHNPVDIRPQLRNGEAADWADSFVSWLADAVAANDVEALLDYRQRAPVASHAHPEEDHLLPLFVALGASDGHGQLLHNRYSFGTISLGCFLLSPRGEAAGDFA